MGDEMTAALKDATEAENEAKATYDEMMEAKTKEINTLTAQIEEEMMRLGELNVELADDGNDLEETKETVAEDKKYLEGAQTKPVQAMTDTVFLLGWARRSSGIHPGRRLRRQRVWVPQAHKEVRLLLLSPTSPRLIADAVGCLLFTFELALRELPLASGRTQEGLRHQGGRVGGALQAAPAGARCSSRDH